MANFNKKIGFKIFVSFVLVISSFFTIKPAHSGLVVSTHVNSINVKITVGDLFKTGAEALVNIGNSQWMPSDKLGGIARTFAQKGGYDLLLNQPAVGFEKICVIGSAKYGGNLHEELAAITKHVIHAVIPEVRNNTIITDEIKNKFKNAYIQSLKIAEEYGARSIAVPCVGTRVFGWNSELADELVFEALTSFISQQKPENNLKEIILVLDPSEIKSSNENYSRLLTELPNKVALRAKVMQKYDSLNKDKKQNLLDAKIALLQNK